MKVEPQLNEWEKWERGGEITVICVVENKWIAITTRAKDLERGHAAVTDAKSTHFATSWYT